MSHWGECYPKFILFLWKKIYWTFFQRYHDRYFPENFHYDDRRNDDEERERPVVRQQVRYQKK